MMSATIKPTMTDLGVISRMCEGLVDVGTVRESMQEPGCVSYQIPCSVPSGTRRRRGPTTSAIARPSPC